MPIKGKIEVFTRQSVTGWIAAYGELAEKPRLELLLDGKPLATVTADELRPDVAARGFGDGRCQFQIALPSALSDDAAARLQLRIVGSDMLLELPRIGPRKLPAPAAEPGPASPVFIVGSPRSGTSVLANALAKTGYHGFAEGNLLGLSQMIEQRVNWYFDANDSTSPGTLLATIGKAALQAELFAVFKATLDRLNPQHPWFDKTGNPEMVLLLPRVIEAWPNSRVIFARRRGIENVLSRLRKFPERNFAYHCQDWANNMRAWRTTREKLAPARITEVDQREILDDPDAVGSRLATLLGLDERRRSSIVRAFRVDRAQESFPGSAGQTVSLEETGWTEEQKRTFQTMCEEEMHRFNYAYP
jgi:hypothetical protein